MPILYSVFPLVGLLRLEEEAGKISCIRFSERKMPDDSAPSDVLSEAQQQLEAYLSGRIRAFTLPLQAPLSDFSAAVQKAMCAIPYGETQSYGAIAAAIGAPRAAQAVGQACKNNRWPIIIPCHRILASDQKIGGYAGGIDRKRALLALEQPGGAWRI